MVEMEAKESKMAKLLRKNPLFIREAYYTKELYALAEQTLKNYAVGKLLYADECKITTSAS